MRSLVRPLVSVVTYRRWTFLLGGTALLIPYLLIYAAIVQIMDNAGRQPARDALEASIMLICFVLISSAVAFVPAVRILCRTAVETLLGVPLPEETQDGLRSWRSRRRTAVWWVLHIGVGGAVGSAAILGLPMVLLLLGTPFTGEELRYRLFGHTLSAGPALSVSLGLVLLPAIVYLGAGAGRVFARLAPVFLGPSPADRLARLEQEAERLIERNRLARELHDSVGHALTATTLQAGAALGVLDSDPEFARRALSAIEETGRAALEDLDHVLGLLRDDANTRTPQRTLADLGRLFDQTRSAGVEVDADIGPTDRIPPVVSREAYRIVQEGLTNALRHAGKVRVAVRLEVRASRLELEMSNPVGDAEPVRADGGRGLSGIRERVTVLGGRMSAGADDGRWRVRVTIPVSGREAHR